MAIHERDPFSTAADQPAWSHPYDDAFTPGCPECDAARTFHTIEIDLRLAVRDLWILGWAPGDLADEIRRRTDSIDARNLIVHALLDDDAQRSDQAKTDEWTQALTLLSTAAGIESVTPGWIARWIIGHDDPDAASVVLFDALDEVAHLLRTAPR